MWYNTTKKAKGVIIMATVSFDREIIITDKKALEKIKAGLESENGNKLVKSTKNIEEEFRKGREALKKLFYR